MMMTSCNRIDCINCQNNYCDALTEAMENNCPFYKNKEQYEKENAKNKHTIKIHFLQKLQKGETITPINAAFIFDLSIKNFYRYMKKCNIKSKELSILHLEILADEISKLRRNKPDDDKITTRCNHSNCIFNGNNTCQIFDEVNAKKCELNMQQNSQDKITVEEIQRCIKT